jgi:hypothetical protein
VINANMASHPLRTVQKGIDPRNYALVAFGGAGRLHGRSPTCWAPEDRAAPSASLGRRL